MLKFKALSPPNHENTKVYVCKIVHSTQESTSPRNLMPCVNCPRRFGPELPPWGAGLRKSPRNIRRAPGRSVVARIVNLIGQVPGQSAAWCAGINIIDSQSCESGALTLRKGSRQAPPPLSSPGGQKALLIILGERLMGKRRKVPVPGRIISRGCGSAESEHVSSQVRTHQSIHVTRSRGTAKYGHHLPPTAIPLRRLHSHN